MINGVVSCDKRGVRWRITVKGKRIEERNHKQKKLKEAKEKWECARKYHKDRGGES